MTSPRVIDYFQKLSGMCHAPDWNDASNDAAIDLVLDLFDEIFNTGMTPHPTQKWAGKIAPEQYAANLAEIDGALAYAAANWVDIFSTRIPVMVAFCAPHGAEKENLPSLPLVLARFKRFLLEESPADTETAGLVKWLDNY